MMLRRSYFVAES